MDRVEGMVARSPSSRNSAAARQQYHSTIWSRWVATWVSIASTYVASRLRNALTVKQIEKTRES